MYGTPAPDRGADASRAFVQDAPMFTVSVRRAAHLAAVADLLLLLLAGAAPASGQGAVPVDLALFVGLMDPRGAVPHAPILAATGNAISYDDMGALGTLGFEVSVRSRMLPASLRLSAERSFDGHELGRWGARLPWTARRPSAPTS
jgi:hypothetical protein